MRLEPFEQRVLVGGIVAAVGGIAHTYAFAESAEVAIAGSDDQTAATIQTKAITAPKNGPVHFGRASTGADELPLPRFSHQDTADTDTDTGTSIGHVSLRDLARSNRSAPPAAVNTAFSDVEILGREWRFNGPVSVDTSDLDTIEAERDRRLAQANSLFSASDTLSTSGGFAPESAALSVDSSAVIDRSGSTADNTFYIRLSPNGQSLQIFDNSSPTGTPDHSYSVGSVSTLTILGGSGDDSVVIDLTNGNPVPLGGITFDGGESMAGDSLEVLGTSADSGSFLPGDRGAGTIDVNGRQIDLKDTELVTTRDFSAFQLISLAGGPSIPLPPHPEFDGLNLRWGGAPKDYIDGEWNTSSAAKMSFDAGYAGLMMTSPTSFGINVSVSGDPTVDGFDLRASSGRQRSGGDRRVADRLGGQLIGYRAGE